MKRAQIIKVLVVLVVLFIIGLGAYFLSDSTSSLAPVTSEQGNTEESDTLSDAKEPGTIKSAVIPDETDTPAADLIPSDEADESENNDAKTEEPEEIIIEGQKAEPVACDLSVKECSDGSFVGRVAPGCEFAACPVQPLKLAPKAVSCTADVKECSDGSFVGRVAPGCEFAACPVPQLKLQIN